jgi:hypothetical protein
MRAAPGAADPADARFEGAQRGRVRAMEELQRDPLLELEERRRKERQAVEEAGGGESEGFELSEQELIQHASHGDEQTPARIIHDALDEREAAPAVYGEADEEHLFD